MFHFDCRSSMHDLFKRSGEYTGEGGGFHAKIGLGWVWLGLNWVCFGSGGSVFVGLSAYHKRTYELSLRLKLGLFCEKRFFEMLSPITANRNRLRRRLFYGGFPPSRE
jgi:hypothetical protein